MDDIKTVIHIIQEAIQGNQMEAEKFDDAIELLESAKGGFTDEELIDTIDEIQDYFQYLITAKEPFTTEIKEELIGIIEELKQWPK